MGRGWKKSVELMAKIGLLFFVSVLMLAGCEVAVRALVTVRNVGPSFTAYNPVYGKWIRPSISVTRITPEFTMRFSTNSQGFRQPDEVPEASHPVLFLGDSFTMGYGVDDGEEFVALIRKQQPVVKGPFLNAGMGANGNGRWLKFLTREAPRYEPRLVVLQVMDNDFEDNLVEDLFVLRDGELIEQPIPPPGVGQRLQSTINAIPVLAYLHLVGLLRQVRLPFGATHAGNAPDDASDPDALTFALVDRAISICQERRWPVIGLSVGIDGPRLARLKRLFGERQATLLEAPSQPAHPDLYYEVDGHWNAKGHAQVADLVTKALE